MNFFKKFSVKNIFAAGKSSFFAAALGIGTAVLPKIVDGSFNTGFIVAGIFGAVIGALTDMLNEVKKEANS